MATECVLLPPKNAMAASLVRLGHRTMMRVTECFLCGGAASSVIRNGEYQRLNFPQKYAGAARSFSSTANVVEETGEPDELFRKVTVEVKGHDHAVLNSYSQFVSLAASELNINLASITEPPRDIRRYTVLKSVHIHSKHMVQYEARTQYRLFELKHLTGSTADTFLEYIQRNLPEGMAMKVTKDRLERIPEYLVPPKKSSDSTSSSAS